MWLLSWHAHFMCSSREYILERGKNWRGCLGCPWNGKTWNCWFCFTLLWSSSMPLCSWTKLRGTDAGVFCYSCCFFQLLFWKDREGRGVDMLILISISFSFNITSALTGGLCIIKLEEFPLNLNDRSFISWNYVVCTYKFFLYQFYLLSPLDGHSQLKRWWMNPQNFQSNLNDLERNGGDHW